MVHGAELSLFNYLYYPKLYNFARRICLFATTRLFLFWKSFKKMERIMLRYVEN